MGPVLRNYLSFIRGEGGSFLWNAMFPLELTARVFWGFRSFSYDHGIAASSESPIPVLSVGNITHGGTNKTPFVEMLCRMVSLTGLRAGVVTRGYGRACDQPLLAGSSGHTRRETGDEALLLSKSLSSCPVAVSRDRTKGVALLEEQGVELAVADDGFQHRAMGRDVDIVLVDATCPFGNRRMMPSGMLREPLESLKRAHMVVLSRSDQVTPDRLEQLRDTVSLYADRAGIFTSRLELHSWSKMAKDGRLESCERPDETLYAFSAIGNPSSFSEFLKARVSHLAGHMVFRDHHGYSAGDLIDVVRRAGEQGASALVCTEKDMYNLPEKMDMPVPLYVPLVRSVMGEPERFAEKLTDLLRPRLVVASNGYGEDAIGSLLAEKLRRKFPDSQVQGFSLVGSGREYRDRGIDVVSPPSETPSGGVIKYRLKDLLRDIRAGLLSHITAQVSAWKNVRGLNRTVLCVGDVYLLLHTLWGQGMKPALVATAKTTLLHGHWRIERLILWKRCRLVWTRDEQT
ncbi:MAG: tetraacyldisaccharide 4'-kinase, partial [Synergistota bacterium]|nr:tetraacyldisaccharide 4'-kinase [Synergistota bacterium]